MISNVLFVTLRCTLLSNSICDLANSTIVNLVVFHVVNYVELGNFYLFTKVQKFCRFISEFILLFSIVVFFADFIGLSV